MWEDAASESTLGGPLTPAKVQMQPPVTTPRTPGHKQRGFTICICMSSLAVRRLSCHLYLQLCPLISVPCRVGGYDESHVKTSPEHSENTAADTRML